MKRIPHPNQARGFSLLELLLAIGIFLVISWAIFGLLDTAQQRNRSEQDFMDSFQNARLGVEQIGREVRNAGYPRPFTYTATPDNVFAAPPDLQRRFAIPFRGSPSQACIVNGGCAVPNGFNLSMELDLDPMNPTCPEQVEIVDYQLVGDPPPAVTSTLMRRVQSKLPIVNPAGCMPNPATFVPFVENVLNNPADPLDPVFTYECTGACTPEAIQSVGISLRVRSSRPDPRTRQFRVITLNGTARRMNSSYP